MHSDAAFPAALLCQRTQGIGTGSDNMSMTFHALQLYAEDIELRLHDMVEVVGVYQYVPEVVALGFGNMTLDEAKRSTFQPIPCLVSKTIFLVIMQAYRVLVCKIILIKRHNRHFL